MKAANLLTGTVTILAMNALFNRSARHTLGQFIVYLLLIWLGGKAWRRLIAWAERYQVTISRRPRHG